MLTYSSRTTRRLEGCARARGLDLGILASDSNSGGRYFVVREGTDLLTHWSPLGWTAQEAEAAIASWAAHWTVADAEKAVIADMLGNALDRDLGDE